MSGVDESLNGYIKWCGRLGITSTDDINRIVSEGKTARLINLSEAWHEQNISEIARKIKDGNKKLILISGPSSSGKTTFAKKLKLHLKVLGIRAYSISLDDYYIDKSDMPKTPEGKPDYEALESIDYRRFNESAAELIAGGEITLPQYDFETSTFVRDAKRLKLTPHELVIAEGIHGLNPRVSESVNDGDKFKIYCTALSALKDKTGERIHSGTNRMIRRMIRDAYFRNTSYAQTLGMWAMQEAGAKKYIFPFSDSADVIFNSSLLYEFGVYKKHLKRALEKPLHAEKDAEVVAEITGIAESFDDIPDEAVPRVSLVREFIGGGTL